ncbi:MAG: hypothetical protein JKY95_08985 [Planctomycetaceae bacterium]|nr:hypothetical protein [Planctomycetaceae bacterium]
MRFIGLCILLFAFFSGIVVTPDSARAGWPWAKRDPNNGLKKYSSQWWSHTGSLPVGSRQVYKHGKLWPPRPRPTCEQQTFSQQYHSAHFWPDPYNKHDRNSINAFDAAQTNQGWKIETTLFAHHFNPESNELSKSGREKVLWIIQTQNGSNRHHAVHVQISAENHVNTIRVASVNNYLGELHDFIEQPLNVVLEMTLPMTRPAREVDLYQKAWVDGMIAPHIPYSVDGTGGE